MNKRILIIHPYDKTTVFLDKIKTHLQHHFSDQIHYYSVKPNISSHSNCLDRISTHAKDGLIIFLGHGSSEALHGSKGKFHENVEFVDPRAIEENPDHYYYNNRFIFEENISVFKEKKVFCLSCNSNGKIADYALRNGVTCFLGFGSIPTSISEFTDAGENAGKDVIKMMKTELNDIVKKSLVNGINNSDSFRELLARMRFITRQKIANTLIKKKWMPQRHLLTDYLYYFQKEALIIGDRNVKLLS